jgi:exonuclease VII large subunit
MTLIQMHVQMYVGDAKTPDQTARAGSNYGNGQQQDQTQQSQQQQVNQQQQQQQVDQQQQQVNQQQQQQQVNQQQQQVNQQQQQVNQQQQQQQVNQQQQPEQVEGKHMKLKDGTGIIIGPKEGRPNGASKTAPENSTFYDRKHATNHIFKSGSWHTYTFEK